MHRFGPNTFPANNSALYACEVQVDYASRALVKPLVDGVADVIEVKEAVENRTTNDIHIKLRDSVFAGKCSNWYIGDFGRNAASWPGMAIEFWLATLFPDRSAFVWRAERKARFYTGLFRQLHVLGTVRMALISLTAVYGLGKLGLLTGLTKLIEPHLRVIKS